MKIKYPSNEMPRGLGQGITNPHQYMDHREAIDLVDELDRLDIFAGIKVVSEEYERHSGSGGVGIVRDKDIHRDGSPVVFEHQSRAAEYFLKRLRGIGILADEVGMGKTFEAGLVLSELAKLGQIESLLVVATNIKDWQNVLGIFGITELLDISSPAMWDSIDFMFDAKGPIQPMIMDMETFKKRGAKIANRCFDALVIDEAHQLRDEGMNVLASFMKTKTQCKKPYCILVSGTPHRGKLEDMFPLWFFAHTKGVGITKYDAYGNVRDEYTKALDFFTNNLCRGAKTIAEFVEASWKAAIESSRYADDYRVFAREFRAKNKDALDQDVRDGFFRKNPKAKQALREIISREYNSNLIGRCMMRQSRALLEKSRTKRASNYYFCPITKFDHGEISMEVVGNEARTDASRHNDIDYVLDWRKRSARRKGSEDEVDIVEFMRSLYNPDRTESYLYRQEANRAVFEAVRQLGGQFGKAGGEGYFRDAFDRNAIESNIADNLVFVEKDSDQFVTKAEFFCQLMERAEYKGKRIIVFFDSEKVYGGADSVGGYQSKATISEPMRLMEWLKKNGKKSILDRLITPDMSKGAAQAAEYCSEEFYKKPNSILFAAPPLDESFNLQKGCHIVVNFSISPDPVKTDQSIGRVDRIGQKQEIEVISLAYTNSLEGYLLTFYNQIKMFSDWKSDIIVAAGCNSDTIIKQCPKCDRIVLWMQGQSEECVCGSRLGNLKRGSSYRCSKCGFKLQRSMSDSRVHNYAYICPVQKQKLCQPEPGVERYMCDKGCAVSRCDVVGENCEIKRLRNAGIRCADEITVCRKCRAHGLNQGCNMCGVDIDVSQSCASRKCRSRHNCNLLVIDFSDPESPSSCPSCRTGTLVVQEQKSFMGFVNQIWEFVSEYNGVVRENFVSNFTGETEKVLMIIETLTKNSEDIMT